MYRVFVANWWKHNPQWPDSREPDASARKTTLQRDVKTQQEASAIAKEYNRTHKPGKLSRKAEFEEQ